MEIQAIVFDLNGTLIEILTEDDRDDIFRAAGHLLTYQGIELRRHEVRDLYFQTLKRQRQASRESYPEFDAVEVWRGIIDSHATDYTRALPTDKLAQLPVLLAEMYRGISRRRLGLFPNVLEVLNILHKKFRLAVVSDGQSTWARGELHKVGLTDYFDPIIISGDHGFRKPDPRLFRFALDSMGIAAADSVYVGNDMYRDIYGAREVGMTTVMFDSDQGVKEHDGCVPDYTITDHRQLLEIVEPQ
jgi:putative hydrolase of the HAD superfamily